MDVGAAWDALAGAYSHLVPDLGVEAPLDRAVLGAFAEMAAGPGVVAEVGCGTGRVAGWLAGAGLRVVGLDLSPGMLAVARSTAPVAVADLRSLPIASGVLAGLVSWYSVINLPPDQLAGVFAEFVRVLRPAAALVLGFQSGDGERVDRTTAYGLPVAMTYYRHDVDAVVAGLTTAGLTLHAVVRREPVLPHESTRQALVLAHRGPVRPARGLSPPVVRDASRREELL